MALRELPMGLQVVLELLTQQEQLVLLELRLPLVLQLEQLQLEQLVIIPGVILQLL